MYLPEFVLTKREKEILANKLTKRVLVKEMNHPFHAYIVDQQQFNEISYLIKLLLVNNICMNHPFHAYIVDQQQFNEIANFTEGYRHSINENRPQVLRAVTQIVNTMSDVQRIKDPDLRTAAGASILSAIMGVYTIAPEYGNRLIGMLKSKI